MIALWTAAALAAKPIEVPLDIGVGPAVHLVTGPVFRDRPLHTGLVFSAAAVIDKKTIRRNRRRIPARYRKAAMQVDEIRISHPLIPRTIWISPAVGGATTGMYGIQFRPLGIGVPLVSDGVRLDVSAGVVLAYAYLHSQTLPSPTHFLRPGIDPGITLEIPFTDRFLMSVGWKSQLYVPQPVGGSILEVGPLQDAIWHIGQGFVKVHVRSPIKVRL
ncbi:MAG: hypothetical protein AAF602_06380 [Myxococcota bacterium]